MATAKLTKRFVDAQSATGEEQVFWDAELRGFCLRVSAAGHKSYGIKYRTKGGTQRRYSLGAHGELTPDQARAAAQNAFAQVRAGADPASDARAYREASDLAALASDFLVHRPLRPETRRQYDSLLARFILPRMRHRKVAEVDRGTVARLFHEMSASGPTQANRALALLSVMFSHAVTTGARSDNPCHGIKRNPERNRERFLERDEIGRLLRACAEHPDERAANFVRLLLYTGARRTETLTATWDMFDLEAGIWTKPSHHTKQKRLHRVPLSDPAIALLRAMKAQAGEGARFVFPRPEADAPLREPKRPVRGIFAAAGIKDATLHTLRHTVASQLAGAGLSTAIIGGTLGHTQAATTQKYMHLADAPLRVAVNVFADIAASTPPEASNADASADTPRVVSIDAARRRKSPQS